MLGNSARVAQHATLLGAGRSWSGSAGAVASHPADQQEKFGAERIPVDLAKFRTVIQSRSPSFSSWCAELQVQALDRVLCGQPAACRDRPVHHVLITVVVGSASVTTG